MTDSELLFFSSLPQSLAIYERLRTLMLAAFPALDITVQRSQIRFKARYGFAFVSTRRMRGCPPVFLIVSFGLGYRLSSPRIAAAVEPYPGRWTHHVIVGSADELDDELMGWLREAYDFSQTK